MKNYNCFTCQEPLKVTPQFHSYIRLHGPQVQRCNMCGAEHLIDEKNLIALRKPGTQSARLSQEYEYPEYKPHRVGAYRVRYSSGNWAKSLATWDGDVWRNGPILFQAGSIIAWQGLAGDMEYLKRIPYVLNDPLPWSPEDDQDA